MPRLSLILMLAATVPLSAAIDSPVRVDGGMLAGANDAASGVSAFKGIPFAAPPVGALRWREPQPAAKWEGVRQAARFSAECMQAPYAEGSPYRSPAEPMSEDCLYLNVWTAAKSAAERRPVMVWIYGGALTRGSASLPGYDGAELARKGVVLVSCNYRLGAFGFFAHPELTAESPHHSSGNYGFLDQIAALQWVQRNIAQFGGDPNQVTIFGESAGSWSVNVLVASPLAKGLFQRAIGESGANFDPMTKLADMEQSGARAAKLMGADSLAAARAKSADEVLRQLRSPSAANVDGWLLPADVYSIFTAGKQNDVPVLIGSNADEGTAFTPPNLTVAGFHAAAARYAPMTDSLLAIYPADSDAQARAAEAGVIRDQTFGWEMEMWARLQARTGKSKTYMYYFSRVPPGRGSEALGAYHSAEIPYVFHNLDANRPWEEWDRKLSELMSQYWVNFAAAGDPNAKAMPQWPVYDPKNERAMGLGDRVEPIAIPHQHALDFFHEWFARQRAK